MVGPDWRTGPTWKGYSVSFYSGKRVLVTGGKGFLGSHLVDELLARDATVAVMDDLSRRNSIPQPWAADFDAGNIERCIKEFKAFNPFAVFNLAASVAGVLYNQSHNLEMFERNIRLQTAPVLAAKAAGVPHFLQVSSVCVYAPEHAEGASEENGQLGEPVAANNGYAWAKRLGERAALWAGLPHSVIVRPSNMYGPRDYFDDRAHVIPALIRKCIESDVIRVHGTGDEVREFLYVEDCAQGMLAALEHGGNSGIYNIGTHGETAINIADLVAMIQRATGTEHKPVEFTGGDAGDKARWSNCSLASAVLGWQYKIGLEEGLRRMVEWHTREMVTA